MNRFLTGAARVAILTLYLLVGGISLLASVPETAIRLPVRAKLSVLTLLPQGWAFFTRNPREPTLEAWAQARGGWQLLPLNVSGTTELLGFRRTLRLRTMELGSLASSLQPEDWKVCSGSINGCVAAGTLSSVTRIVNRSSARQLCGPLVLAIREPQPWAWRSRAVSMPARATRVDAECPQ